MKFIDIIENNPVALATSDKKGKPHVIAVACVKVKDDKIIITNNYMKTTIDNIKQNPKVSLVAWGRTLKGCKIDGIAEYFENGEWYNFVKAIKENENEPCKGAIVIKVNSIKGCG